MYSKEYFRKQLLRMLEPLKKHYHGGSVLFGGHCAWYENKSADMEAFARPLWGLVPFWAGGGNDADFERLYTVGIADGTDEMCAGYWGECHDRDQRFVEMAALAYGILFAPDKVWEPLEGSVKNNLEKWLNIINERDVCDSNWIFFRVLVNIALRKVNRRYSADRLKSDLDRIDEFYLGGGWYQDGIHGQRDYYVAFALHFYGLIYAIVMKEDDAKRSEEYINRACEFARDFAYWFDADGEALPYGRSLTYRFAQTAFWSACVIAGARPFSLGVMKGIISRNLNSWVEKPIFDSEGLLTVGYDYPNLIMAEHYNAHGSPYWGLKAYAFLMLPDDHEFWSCIEEPMPELCELKKLEMAKMLVSRRNGRSVAYVSGDNEYFDCGQIAAKYLKFAYSAHFGFNVTHSLFTIEEAAPDSTLAFVVDSLVMPRRHFLGCKLLDDRLVTEWSPFEGIDVKTTVIPQKFGHIREHEIRSEYDCIAFDSGFAVANRDSDVCVSGTDGGAYAENKFQRCDVKTESRGEYCIINASPNTNLRYQKTVIPSVKYEIKKGNMRVRTLVYDHLEEKL